MIFELLSLQVSVHFYVDHCLCFCPSPLTILFGQFFYYLLFIIIVHFVSSKYPIQKYFLVAWKIYIYSLWIIDFHLIYYLFQFFISITGQNTNLQRCGANVLSSGFITIQIKHLYNIDLIPSAAMKEMLCYWKTIFIQQNKDRKTKLIRNGNVSSSYWNI